MANGDFFSTPPPPPPKDLLRTAYLGSRSDHSLATSPTSVSRSLAHSITPSVVPSIQRAESEDPESFHVRATYAQLDVLGVPLDGVSDGIERTRARLGASLDDLGQARDASPARELDVAEAKVLSSLDRYGFFRVDTHDRLVQVDASTLR